MPYNSFTHEKMKKILNKIFVTLLFSVGLLLFSGCSKDNPGGDKPDTSFKLTGVSIPGTISVTLNSNVTITAKGFAAGDIIKFASKSETSKVFQFPVSNVTANSATINIG